MAATASVKRGAKSEVNSWLGDAFREEWEQRARSDKARPKFAPKPKRAKKPRR